MYYFPSILWPNQRSYKTNQWEGIPVCCTCRMTWNVARTRNSELEKWLQIGSNMRSIPLPWGKLILEREFPSQIWPSGGGGIPHNLRTLRELFIFFTHRYFWEHVFCNGCNFRTQFWVYFSKNSLRLTRTSLETKFNQFPHLENIMLLVIFK